MCSFCRELAGIDCPWRGRIRKLAAIPIAPKSKLFRPQLHATAATDRGGLQNFSLANQTPWNKNGIQLCEQSCSGHEKPPPEHCVPPNASPKSTPSGPGIHALNPENPTSNSQTEIKHFHQTLWHTIRVLPSYKKKDSTCSSFLGGTSRHTQSWAAALFDSSLVVYNTPFMFGTRDLTHTNAPHDELASSPANEGIIAITAQVITLQSSCWSHTPTLTQGTRREH